MKYILRGILTIIFSIPLLTMNAAYANGFEQKLPTKAITFKKGDQSLQAKRSIIDYVNIVKGFLPKDSQIVTLSNTKEVDNILLIDIDNDGRSEIISAYKYFGESNKINVIVLKRAGGNWTKVLDEPGYGFMIESVLTEDIDGDGQNEVLLSRRIGGTLGQLSIYKLNNNLLNKISNKDILYSKFYLVSVPGKSIKAIATWQHDTGDAYKVDVLKWNGKDFNSAKELYVEYFKKAVVPYYERKVKEMPEAGFYWYYLADAQIKGGDKKAALKSIEKGLSLNKNYPLKEDFYKLKEKILSSY